MANIFLDANKVFDITIRKPEETIQMVEGHNLYISPLSCHILFYAESLKVPSADISDMLLDFKHVNFNKKILKDAMKGPTSDLEDNVQLHSAVSAKCKYFLTNDKNLLKLKNFKKVKIVNKLP